MKRLSFIALSAVIFLVGGYISKTSATEQGVAFTIFYSNDVRGETEPCG